MVFSLIFNRLPNVKTVLIPPIPKQKKTKNDKKRRGIGLFQHLNTS